MKERLYQTKWIRAGEQFAPQNLTEYAHTTVESAEAELLDWGFGYDPQRANVPYSYKRLVNRQWPEHRETHYGTIVTLFKKEVSYVRETYK